jgi:5-methylcytosine-specific restriction protein A
MPTRSPVHRPQGWKPREQVKREVDRLRPSARERGYGTDWVLLRAIILKRDPICKHCGQAKSKHVDHILSRKRGGTDDPSNLQGLCWSCHSRKTVREDGGWGR